MEKIVRAPMESFILVHSWLRKKRAAAEQAKTFFFKTSGEKLIAKEITQ